MDRESLIRILQSPRSGEDLVAGQDCLEVPDREPLEQYPCVDGLPVLVDFETSVLDRSACLSSKADSVVNRRKYRGILGWAKQLVSQEKGVTKANVQWFADQIQKGGSKKKPVVLVVGGGKVGQGMSRLYDDPSIEVVAFDIYASPNISFIADAHRIPVKSGVVDGVVIQAVLEHVVEPAVVVGEIHRVLKDDGLVYAETPFLQHVHEAAYDYTRYTERGHRYLFRDFREEKSGASGGPGTQMNWSIDYFVRSLTRSRVAGKIAKLLFFWLVYLDALVPERFAVDAASGVFFLGRKSNERIGFDDLVAGYRGAQG